MNQTMKNALLRSVASGFVAFGGALFAALAVVAADGITTTEFVAALVGAGGALFGALGWRNLEGKMDSNNAIQRAADEEKKNG